MCTMVLRITEILCWAMKIGIFVPAPKCQRDILSEISSSLSFSLTFGHFKLKYPMSSPAPSSPRAIYPECPWAPSHPLPVSRIDPNATPPTAGRLLFEDGWIGRARD